MAHACPVCQRAAYAKERIGSTEVYLHHGGRRCVVGGGNVGGKGGSIDDGVAPSLFDVTQRSTVSGRMTRQDLIDGCVCGECGRLAKATVRPFNVTMVRTLRWLAERSGERREWVDVPARLREEGLYDYGKQYSQSKYWGFLEHKENDGHTKTKESGLWRVTDEGYYFLGGRLPIRKVITFNDQVIGHRGGLVFVDQITEGFRWPPEE